jgi:hypothetical protein
MSLSPSHCFLSFIPLISLSPSYFFLSFIPLMSLSPSIASCLLSHSCHYRLAISSSPLSHSCHYRLPIASSPLSHSCHYRLPISSSFIPLMSLSPSLPNMPLYNNKGKHALLPFTLFERFLWGPLPFKQSASEHETAFYINIVSSSCYFPSVTFEPQSMLFPDSKRPSVEPISSFIFP